MFKGGRLRDFAIGLGGGVFLCGMLSGMLLGNAWNLEAKIREDAEKNAAHYAQAADIAIQRECVEISSLARTQCLIEKREAQREAQRSEYDLEAQRFMAVWTETMGLAAIIGMAVGLIGLGLIYATFQQTRRQAYIAERALEIQTRPFLYLDSVDWEESRYPDGDQVFEFTFNLKNLGKLPATNVRLWTSAIPVPSRDDYHHTFRGEPVVVTACPQGVTRKIFDQVYLDGEEASYFETMNLGVALAVRVIFDTRFTKDKCIEEFRWADARGLSRNKLVFLDRPKVPDDGPTLFDQDGEGERSG